MRIKHGVSLVISFVLSLSAIASTTVHYAYNSQTHLPTSIAQGVNTKTYVRQIGDKSISQKHSWYSAGPTSGADQISYVVSPSMGLILHSTDSFKHKIQYLYGNNGIANISTSGANISYQYDNLGRVAKIIRLPGYATNNSYNAMGALDVIRLKGRTQRPAPTRPLPTDIKYQYTFNPDHNVTGMTIAAGGTTIANYHYYYNLSYLYLINNSRHFYSVYHGLNDIYYFLNRLVLYHSSTY